MEQYTILYKRGNGPWSKLEPNITRKIYDRPEVNEVIDLMRDRPAFRAAVVQLEDELFNIIRSKSETLAANAFALNEDA